MEIFDGIAFAQAREQQLAAKVAARAAAGAPRIVVAAILFDEDSGSRLYTRLKQEAAERVGMSYEVHHFSLTNGVEPIQAEIRRLSAIPEVTGIIIQKPRRSTWVAAHPELSLVPAAEQATQYLEWWQSLTSQIDPHKDVDGLQPETLAAVAAGSWQEQDKVLPATCKAVLEILRSRNWPAPGQKVVILGASDLMGRPLSHVLRHQGLTVELLGSKGLRERQTSGLQLTDADILVSATGQAGLVTGEMVKAGVIIVDVGEPRGDVDRASLQDKALFLTPVPGGVGPVTVVSLLENALFLAEASAD